MLSYILPAPDCPRPADVLSDSLCKYSVAVKAFREEQNVLFVVNENENMPSLSHCDEIPNARQAQRNEPRYPMSTSVGLHILTPPILLKNLLFNRKTVLTASESSPFNFSSHLLLLNIFKQFYEFICDFFNAVLLNITQSSPPYALPERLILY